jgi:hypothetical protein
LEIFIIIKEGLGNFCGGRIPHWVNHLYLCLYCIVYFSILFSHLSYFYSFEIFFYQQLVLEKKVTRRKKGFLVRVGEMVEDGNFRVEKFNGQNNQLWKMHMEYYLYQKFLFLPLGGITKKSTTMKDKE